MRLFVAVWPDAAAVEHLDAALAPVRARVPDLRWQPLERWHVTLAFLGEVAEGRVGAARDAAEAVASRHGGVPEIRLAGSGTFDRVLWTGLAPSPSPLAPVARDLALSLRASGFAIERRPWAPHLTLARARGETSPVRAACEALAGYAGPAWPVREITLVRSVAGPHPAYDVLDRLPLQE